ncbi:unnamed protein product [Adineta ricciae]|uniref:Uncharacterized protein n=1 Tax=Adineta ricciae TaxID=249248 RepID=A0A815PKH5_ADIRI|nr:unnamed protein product [Adineta ricciae]
MKYSFITIVIFITTILTRSGQADEINFRNLFANAIKTPQDQNVLTRLEQSLPQFLDFDIPSNENVDKVFAKFKEAIRLFPANIQRETALNEQTARDIFPALQPIYRYVKLAQLEITFHSLNCFIALYFLILESKIKEEDDNLSVKGAR